MRIPGRLLSFLKGECERLSVEGPETVVDSVGKLRHFAIVRRFTYDFIGQWPDLTYK